MYVVTVEFDLDARFVSPFMEAMRENARESRICEPGCRQFDICSAEADSTKVFLYEVYQDRAAFETHMQTEHFKRFDASVRAWVRNKNVRTYLGADISRPDTQALS